MKKVTLLFACLVACVAQAKVKEFDDRLPIVPLREITTDRMQAFLVDQNFIIKFQQGEQIPLQLLMTNPIFSATLNPNLKLAATQTCYLRVVRKKCYVSFDGIHWENQKRLMSPRRPALTLENQGPFGFTLRTDYPAKSDVDEN